MEYKRKLLSIWLAAALAIVAVPLASVTASGLADAEAPQVYGVTLSPSPAALGDKVTVTAVVNDGIAEGSAIKSAKFSVDGGNYQGMNSTDGQFNTPAEGVAGSFSAIKLGSAQVCVKARDAAGNESQPACAQLMVESQISFGGFFEPVSNYGNFVQTGRVVPLKWAVVDANGDPLVDRSVFRGIWSYEVDCSSLRGDQDKAVQEVGRFNTRIVSVLTSGEWTALWRPQKAYADSCRMLYALFSDGSTSPEVMFRFK